MKTPEEIKQGLEAIAETNVAARAEKVTAISKTYRYLEDVAGDALVYIQRLEAERAALVRTAETFSELCTICKHRWTDEIHQPFCDACDHTCSDCAAQVCPCRDCQDTHGAKGFAWNGGAEP